MDYLSPLNCGVMKASSPLKLIKVSVYLSVLSIGLSACVPPVAVNTDEGGEMSNQDSNGGGIPALGGMYQMAGIEMSAGIQMSPGGGMMNMNTEPALSCNIGEKLGLCEICGPNNTRVEAMNDTDCPSIECSDLNSHRLVSDEEERFTCYYREYENRDSNCQGPGVCINDPNVFCNDDRPEIIINSTVDLGPCYLIEGCDGQTPPQLIPQPGTPCDEGSGTCDDAGDCILTPSCLTHFDYNYNAVNQLCSDMLSTQNRCEFYVSAEDNPWNEEKISCNLFCSSRGGSCLKAWAEEDNNCEKKDEKDCDSIFTDGICRCSPPSQ